LVKINGFIMDFNGLIIILIDDNVLDGDGSINEVNSGWNDEKSLINVLLINIKYEVMNSDHHH